MMMRERSETDGLVTDAIKTVLVSARWLWESLRQTTAEAAKPAASAPSFRRYGAPATLAEVGVPGSLASEMELVMRLTRDPRFTFLTPDGVRHRIVLPEDVRKSQAA